jgi:protein-S-isoprenylcysteine O-methyltransferase Ste14
MFDVWPIALTVSGLATSGLFARAVRGHFASEKLPPAMKLLVALSYLAIFAYIFALWTGAAPLWQRIACVCLQILAAGVFNWARTTTLGNRFTAAFDTDEPAFLVKTGPYRFVRHPFYISYIVFWVGSSLGGNSLILWFVCLVLIGSYVVAALSEEQKFKNSPLAADYSHYSKRTGFLFPKLPVLLTEDQPESRPRP